MKKTNIVVTGGLGFIGSNLVINLIKNNYFVIILDKKTYCSNVQNLSGISKKKYKLFIGDINNKKLLNKIINQYKPFALFNLAAETHVDRSIDSPIEFINSNVIGVFNILEILRKNKKIIKFIHISTDEVYGDLEKNKFASEKSAYNPSSPYAASKASSDLLIKSYSRTYNVPTIITNCCNNYGPRQYPEKLIPKLIYNLKNHKNLPIYGTGRNEREWIHVDDHCNALIKLLKSGKVGNSYNIGSGKILNNNNISKILIKLFKNKKLYNQKSKIKYIKDRPGHDTRYALNSQKIKFLGWRAKKDLIKGLNDTIDWYLQNQKWLRNFKNINFEKRIGLKK